MPGAPPRCEVVGDAGRVPPVDPSRPDRAALVEPVRLHEFAHLVGLAHVEDPGQLVNPSTSGPVEHAAGDLTGLAALGTGPCLGT